MRTPASRAPAPEALRLSDTVLVTVVALAFAVGLGALTAGRPLVGLGVALVAVLAVATTIRPEIATLVAVFLVWANVPAVAVNTQGMPRSIGIAVPLIMVLPLLYHLLRGQRIIATPVLWLLVTFLIVQGLSAVFARDQALASEGLQTFLFEGIIVYFLASNVVRSTATVRRVIWTLIIAGGLLGALSLFQTLTGTFDRPYGGFAEVGAEYFRGLVAEPRLSGPLGDANYYAQILVALVPLGLLRVFAEHSPRLKLAAGALTALMLIGIAFTLSRGAAVTLVALLVLMVMLRYVSRNQAFAIVAAGLVFFLVLPQYRDRVFSISEVTNVTAESGSAEAADISLRGRLLEMKAAGLAFADNPILGVGPRNFPVHFQKYAAGLGEGLHQRVRFGPDRGGIPERESHNIFLGIAADLGLAGLAIFVATLGVTVGMLEKARRLARRAARPDLANLAAGFILAIGAYAISGLFLTLAFERYLWLLLGLATATAVVVMQAARSEEARSAVRGRVPQGPSTG